MEEPGVLVDHSSINRWAVRFLPHIEKMARKHKRPVGGSWRMDDIYIKVKGVWKYLYRAVDKQGKTHRGKQKCHFCEGKCVNPSIKNRSDYSAAMAAIKGCKQLRRSS